MKNIDIIAACSDLGGAINGTYLGPEKLLEAISKENANDIKKICPSTKYKKDLNPENLKRNLDEINKVNSLLYKEVLLSLKNNKFPLILGGDHSIAIGSALASIENYSNLGIIWFDAHGDFNTFKTTSTGNIHGLPFAAITNYEKNFLTTFCNNKYYNCKNAVLLGARDIDKPYELQNLENAGVTIITTDDINKFGIDTMYKKAFDIASNGTNGVHISYDLDVIDPQYIPGVSVPASNGITLEQAMCFVDYVVKNKTIIKSIDLVEFNPLLDNDCKTEKFALKIINKIIKNFG